MKMKILVMVILSFLIASFSYAGEKITVQINGLNCSLCEKDLAKKFKAHPHTDLVEIDLIKLEVKLTPIKNQTVSDQEITQILTAAGFIVEKITRTNP